MGRIRACTLKEESTAACYIDEDPSTAAVFNFYSPKAKGGVIVVNKDGVPGTIRLNFNIRKSASGVCGNHKIVRDMEKENTVRGARGREVALARPSEAKFPARGEVHSRSEG